ncbi:MAG TPA: hypothetical protein VES40_12855 [Ilumatobacteraceae bacterium]|nr:hypothetical protein [Ilumatobacteraceae bacterium]
MDVDRAAVYAAELAAFDGTDLEDVIDFPSLVQLMRSVTTGEWWPGPDVDVIAARSDAASSSTRCAMLAAGGRMTIRLAATQMTAATAAHELAHALAGLGDGHGPVFRAAYLDVVAVITNVDSTDRRRELHVDQLATAFADVGLRGGDRRWPPPPGSTTAAIAL